MVDWNGLFKWSMKYQDDDHRKDIKPMDEKTKKWLEEAMEDYTFNEIKRMKQIIEILEKEEKNTKEDEETRLGLLEELQDLVEGIENARDLDTIGGLKILVDLIFKTQYNSNRIIALQIFASCNQNNAKIQASSISYGAFKLINIILDNKYEIKQREAAFSGLNAMIRGEHLEGKRQFLDAEGVEFIMKCIEDENSIKIKYRALSLLKDLVQYDCRLHLTVNNTDNYANTNAEKSKTKFHADKDDEKAKQNNELEQNKKFKDSVKNILIQQEFLDKLFKRVLGDLSDQNTDSRAYYLFIAKEIISYDEKVKKDQEKNMNAFKSMFTQILQQNEKNDGINEYEIEQWKQFLGTFLNIKQQQQDQQQQQQYQQQQQQQQQETKQEQPEKILRLN